MLAGVFVVRSLHIGPCGASRVRRLQATQREETPGPPPPQRPHETSKWDSLLTAMRSYHAIHKDLCIEQSWRVPSEPPWPEELWDTRLARQVYHINFWQTFVAAVPERRAELDEMGFIWNRLQPEYNLVLEALLVYKEQYGDLLVPVSFRVPSEPPWPKSCWAMRLGLRVSAIRAKNDHIRLHPQRWFQLDAMGFAFEASENSWLRFQAALEDFTLLHGHALVPKSFVVPDEEPWSENVRGFPLGVTVANMRAKRLYIQDHPERERELAKLGFVWDVRAFRFEVVMSSLVTFKQIHGHVNVPQMYVVPPEAPWPQACWDLPLGRRVKMIRTRGDMVRTSFERRARLDALGFPWHSQRGKQRA